MTHIQEPADFEDADFDSDFGDLYDSEGNCSEGGLYDAGGHLIGDAWVSAADDLHDKMRDEH